MTPTLKEAVRFSETSLNIYQYRQRHIPEECEVDDHRHADRANRVLFPSRHDLPLILSLSLIMVICLEDVLFDKT
jgi:hypothetical protein